LFPHKPTTPKGVVFFCPRILGTRPSENVDGQNTKTILSQGSRGMLTGIIVLHWCMVVLHLPIKILPSEFTFSSCEKFNKKKLNKFGGIKEKMLYLYIINPQTQKEMKQKRIYVSKYITIDWYNEGIFFGIGKIDNSIGIILPFLIIDIQVPKKRKIVNNEL
jgi:hypothetical protein